MSNLIISISGVRGIVGAGLTPEVAARFGCAFSTLLGGGTVVVGRDTRPSGEMVRSALVSGLISGGTRVVDLGVATTPATALAVRNRKAEGGIVITASHNPAPYNGIKFLRPSGTALSAETGAKLRAIFESGGFRFVGVEGLHAVEAYDRAAQDHVDAVAALPECPPASSRAIHAVLDSVNGAGCVEGPMMLQRLGCRVTAVAGVPDGRFPHPPEPTAENLVGLCAAVTKHKADVGFAQDPDADRLAVVDETGRYIGEEYTLALCARYLLTRRKGDLAANLSTSRMIDDLAAAAGVKVHRTPVGEAHVADAIAAHNCVLGGEGNGGVIEPRIVPVRDSLTSMAYIVGLMRSTGKTLSALVDEMPRYHMIKTKFECPLDRAARIVDAIAGKYRDRPVNRSDGIRIEFDDAWVHLRPSNTEPIFRVIGEAPTAERAIALCRRLEDEAKAV